MINKLRWFIYRKMEKYLQRTTDMSNNTYYFRKKFYFKVLRLDKELCHFCLKPSRDYYCWECAEETC